MADWLPHDLLLKLDRCLMAHAVEGRTPFLDRGVAAAAFRLPDGLKLRRAAGEVAAAPMAGKKVPVARPFAPKQGFTVPIGAWIGARRAARPAGRGAAGGGGDRRCGRGARAVRRHSQMAARFRGLAVAVLRAVAPAAHSGPAAGGGCVRDAGDAGVAACNENGPTRNRRSLSAHIT